MQLLLIISFFCFFWFLLVPAYPASPGQKAIKWLCVCVCVLLIISVLIQAILIENICQVPTARQ